MLIPGDSAVNITFEEKQLPVRYIGYSTAFRREAGTYGKDTKGILRMHQFDKLEMETFCLPENSRQEQDFLVAIQEYVMQQLKLPYQIVMISTGDMGIPDHRQIDLETWMPSQDKYRGVTSASVKIRKQCSGVEVSTRDFFLLKYHKRWFSDMINLLFLNNMN